MICRSRRARLVIFAALSGAAPVFADSAFAGKVGARAERIATQSATFYPYGIYGNLEYRGFDAVVPYTQLRHTQNRRIFDGLGNTETIGVTDMMLGADWEINPQFTLDGFYRAGLGANSYQAHEGTATLVFQQDILEVTGGVQYSRISYIYPGTAVSVLNSIFTPEAEVAFHVHKRVSIPVGVEYSAMQFSSADPYGLFLAHVGIDWKITEKTDWSNRVNFGRDSSDYSILGFNTRPRYRLTDEIRIAIWIDYIRYSKQATAPTSTGGGKKNLTTTSTSSGKTNPLGTTDRFSYFTLGFEVSYSF